MNRREGENEEKELEGRKGGKKMIGEVSNVSKNKNWKIRLQSKNVRMRIKKKSK